MKKIFSFTLLLISLSQCTIIGSGVGKILDSDENIVEENYTTLNVGDRIVIELKDGSKTWGNLIHNDTTFKIIYYKDDYLKKSKQLVYYDNIEVLRNQSKEQESTMTGFKTGLIIDGVLLTVLLFVLRGLGNMH